MTILHPWRPVNLLSVQRYTHRLTRTVSNSVAEAVGPLSCNVGNTNQGMNILLFLYYSLVDYLSPFLSNVSFLKKFGEDFCIIRSISSIATTCKLVIRLIHRHRRRRRRHCRRCLYHHRHS